jgi:hypothetical protein
MQQHDDGTSAALVRRQASGQLAQQQPVENPWANVGLLKPYKADAVVTAPRVDALATISAGAKKPGNSGRMIPSVSRDGKIILHDDAKRAPGLAKVLADRDALSLTIALVSNNPSDILQQRFAAYTATRLTAYGDQNAITMLRARTDARGNEVKNQDGTVIVDREVIGAGEPGFEAVAATCKAQSSLYFALAKWENGQPKLWFPDGLGLYRLRFTSLNSAENIKGSLAYVASLTGGRVSGIPLELRIVNREVSAPDGSRRTVPVWTLVLQPPETIELEAGQVRAILESGLAQARALALPAPRPETLELAEAEGADVDLDESIIEGEVVRETTDRDVRMLRGGGPCDAAMLRSNWFAAVNNSPLDSDEARQRFLYDFTDGRCLSLAEFAAQATRREAEELLTTAHEWIVAERERRQERGEPPPKREPKQDGGRTYEQLFGDDEHPSPTPATQPAKAASTAPANVGTRVHAAAILTGAPPTPAPPAAAPLARPEDGASYTRAQWTEFYEAHAARLHRLDATFRPSPVADFENGGLETEVLRIIAEADGLAEYLARFPDDDTDDEISNDELGAV